MHGYATLVNDGLSVQTWRAASHPTYKLYIGLVCRPITSGYRSEFKHNNCYTSKVTYLCPTSGIPCPSSQPASNNLPRGLNKQAGSSPSSTPQVKHLIHGPLDPSSFRRWDAQFNSCTLSVMQPAVDTVRGHNRSTFIRTHYTFCSPTCWRFLGHSQPAIILFVRW